MNRSGEVIKTILRKTKTELKDIVVIYDNMDLDPGICKLKMQRSTAGHNGLESIFLHTKSHCIMCIAIGIGRPQYKSQVVDYVLSDPSESEKQCIDQAIEKVVSAVLQLILEPAQKVMNVLNKKQ
jgi:PTH1 family peptidyl-tRNA hydrolase